MRSIDYFEETLRVLDGEKHREEHLLFEKLRQAFITPIDREDVYELYLCAIEAKQNNYLSAENIIRNICSARSVKNAHKPIKQFFERSYNESEAACIQRICKIVLKNI